MSDPLGSQDIFYPSKFGGLGQRPSFSTPTGVITHNRVVVRELGSKVSDECARNLVRMQDEICWSALADDFRSFSRISFPEVSHLHVFGAVSKRNATMHPV